MAAAVIVSIAVGIWVGASYIRNKAAWGAARDRKRRLDEAKKKRWATASGLLWPIGLVIVLGLAIAGSHDQMAVTPEGAVSSSLYAVTIASLLLVGWLLFKYVDTARAWKGVGELKAALQKDRKRRWATLGPVVIAVAVLLGLLVVMAGAFG
jgi:H+/Cl- antiporter ClcA